LALLGFTEAARAFGSRPLPPPGVTPQPDAVLFVGSSVIDFWKTLPEDLPGIQTINHGVAATTYSAVYDEIESVIVPYRTRRIVMYSGDNDLAWGRSVDSVFETFQKAAEKIHALLPESKIFVISVKPSRILTRRIHIGQVRRVNAMMKTFAESTDYVTFVNVFDAMLAPDGAPNGDLFVWDGIHMNHEGYKLWASILRPYLDR
jgi:lysophospholipase L1-like esterase